jgi:two-component system LytT family sensor kinase
LLNTLILSAPLYIWSFIYFGYKFIEDIRIEKSKYQETLLRAKEAQLQMLRHQINPHFLFNSLNSIQALMYKNLPLADEMLTEFSEFLRYNLENKDELYVTLEEEIEIISKYLYIEKIRFQEKLNYEIQVAENARKIKILSFLLQPLVENAIKHGLKSKQDILNIEIICSLRDRYLVITIRNSGKWVDDHNKKGIGIMNVRSRLKSAYPLKHIIKIEEGNNWVTIELQIEISDG